MLTLLRKHKHALTRIAILLFVVAIISIIFLIILLSTNIIYFDNGFKFNIELFSKIKNKWWFYILFLAIQIIATTILSFVPGTNMTFILASVALFGATWQTFMLCYSGVILSSVCMDLFGRFGGCYIVKKMIGEKEYNSAYSLVQTKGITYIPIMYLLPIFPDDAICMIAGTMRFNFWLHLLYIVLCRGTGVATIVFGLNLIPYQQFTTFYDWFVLGAVLIVYVAILLKCASTIDKKITEHHKRKGERNEQKDKK